MAVGLLAAGTVLYTSVNLYRLAHFYPLDFDLAIFGQGVWLLSRGSIPFVTVRGMSLFGEHASFVHLLVAPLYTLLGPLAHVRLLVLLQSAALAWAGFVLLEHARTELGSGGARLVLVTYLAYPAVQNTWLEYYEPINLAVPALLAAALAIRAGHARRALVFSLLALSTIETVAATVFALGAYAAFHGRRRLGAVLMTLCVAYVTLLMSVVFPWLSEGGYVYGNRLYGDFARSLPEAIVFLARPDHLLERLATAENGRYLLGLLAPVAFLPLGAPGTLALAVQLPLNMVSSWPYAHEILYHYAAPIIPFVFLGVVRALARFPARSVGRRLCSVALGVGLLAGQVFYGSSWVVPRRGEKPWRGWAADRVERSEVEGLLARLPAEASVAVHYRFLPHLCERRRLFMLPDTGPAGTWPDALVFDEPVAAADTRDREVLERARKEAGFTEVARTRRGTVLLMRGTALVEPPAKTPRSSPPVGWPKAPTTGVRYHSVLSE